MFLQTPISTFHKNQWRSLHGSKPPISLIMRRGIDRVVHRNTAVETKSRGHFFFAKQDFSKSVEVGQIFVTRPAIFLRYVGTTTVLSCMFHHAWWPWSRSNRCPWEIIPSSGPSTMQKYWIKILGGHQSWIGQRCYGHFGRMQTAHVPRNRNSAGRKFQHRWIGGGRGFCIKIKGWIATYKKFGSKFSHSKTSSDTSHG